VDVPLKTRECEASVDSRKLSSLPIYESGFLRETEDGERCVISVNDWRKQYIKASESLRKYFYGDSSSHIRSKEYAKALPDYKLRKKVLYKQFSALSDEDRRKLARKAVVCERLDEPEKGCIFGRYIE
jgi:hypothetical protein